MIELRTVNTIQGREYYDKDNELVGVAFGNLSNSAFTSFVFIAGVGRTQNHQTRIVDKKTLQSIQSTMSVWEFPPL